MVEKEMRIVVVGPGAMGCLIAGLLTEALGYDVWLLDKDPRRADVITRNGVRIDDKLEGSFGKGSRVVRVNISAETATIGSADVIFLCVKSYDTEAAVKHFMPLVGQHTIVVSMQNGSGNIERIAKSVESNQIVCGITSHGSTNLGEGHVRHAGTGPTLVAPFVPDGKEKAEQTAKLLTKSSIDARAVDDMESLVWSKLIINSAINPLTAISNVRNGLLFEDPELRETMRKAASEAAAVAKAKGISLMYDNEVEEVERVCRATRHNVSSMLQDIRRGQRTEIDSITGVIVEEAHAAGIEVPTNEMLLERIKRKERNSREKTQERKRGK